MFRKGVVGLVAALWASGVCMAAEGEPQNEAQAEQRAPGEAERLRKLADMIEELGETHPSVANERLSYSLETLLRYTSTRVRLLAMQILGCKYGLDGQRLVTPFSRRPEALPETLLTLLVEITQSNGSATLRQTAVNTLGRVGGPVVTEAFVPLLEDPALKDSVLGYLVQTYGKKLPADVKAWRREIEADKAGRDKLLTQLQEEVVGYDLLKKIEQRFGRTRDKRVIKPLLEFATGSGVHQEAARRAMRIAGSLAGDESVPEISKILRSEKAIAAVRREAAYALGRIGTEGCLPALLETTKDRQCDPEMRANAARALGSFGAERVGSALLAALGDPDPKVRRCAAEAVLALSGPGVADLLIGGLQHDDSVVRAEAARLIGERRLKVGPDALLKLVSDNDEKVREAAVNALARWRDEKTVAPLVAAYDKAPPVCKRQSSLLWAGARPRKQSV